jgi:acetylornithine deacetylase
MIRRLVAMDTTSRNSNLEIIGFIADHLAGFGIEGRLVHDESGRKANLYATLGPTDKPGIALSGHTDVVPIDGQTWNSDPWLLSEREGRLFGRGTADMKAFLGILLVKAPEMLRREPTTPIHLVFTYDEEVGCLGVRRLLTVLRDLPVRPYAAVVGEPTDMKVMVGHKGKMSMRCHVHGRECHSSLAPEGVNAVEYAAEVIVRLRAMAQRIAREGPFDADFDVAHSTVHTGVARGGTALNIVPKHCSFDFRVPLRARRRSPGAAGRDQGIRRKRACPADEGRGPGGRLHLGADLGLPRARHAGRQRDRRLRQITDRGKFRGEGRLRHRGRPLSGSRYPHRYLRARQHQPGP